MSAVRDVTLSSDVRICQMAYAGIEKVFGLDSGQNDLGWTSADIAWSLGRDFLLAVRAVP
jgi:hypothetical protein